MCQHDIENDTDLNVYYKTQKQNSLMRLDSQGPVAWYRLSLWCFEIAGSRFRAFGEMKYWSLCPGPLGPSGPLNPGAPTWGPWGPQGPDPFSEHFSGPSGPVSKLQYFRSQKARNRDLVISEHGGDNLYHATGLWESNLIKEFVFDV